MTEASRDLMTLARHVAADLVAHMNPRAILLTGSAAAGMSDTYSDLDLIAYYEALPSSERLNEVAPHCGRLTFSVSKSKRRSRSSNSSRFIASPVR